MLLCDEMELSVFCRGDAVQVQADADNEGGAERKTRFVPGSLVQGKMEGA